MSGGGAGGPFLPRAPSRRDHRLVFGGRGTSLVGTWITRVATSRPVCRLTGSAATLGLVGFAGQVPTFLLAPFAAAAPREESQR